jgi:hypothetical protein
MLVADRSGASAVIGARGGKLHADKMKQPRGLGLGFGMRGDFAARMVAKRPEPTPANAAAILKAARQQGKYATRYSNVFDLKSGTIYLYCFPDQAEAVVLSLSEELKKGGHFYDLPDIREQLKRKPKPLTDKMKVD